MINERELRIGNTVYGTYEDEDGKNHTNICRIIAVDETSSLGEGWDCMVELIEGKSVEVYDDFSPIPLTEEWLLNLGLRKHIPSGKNDAIYYINHEGKTVLGYWLIDGAVNIGEFIPKNIKYVHQLQNLYFALTGEELTLKP